jgi:hypothetical protein
MGSKTSPLIARVWAELHEGRISEAYIQTPGYLVDGVTKDSSGHITINPAHAIVDTLIHELLHRLHPEWSENYVRRTVSLLRNQMTDTQVQAFYRAYRRIARRRKTPLRPGRKTTL